MAFRGDQRAVTVQIGAVLLLGVLVISLSIYQVTVIPSQNEGVEFTHNQRVQEDMLSLQSSVQQGAATGRASPVTIELGTTFPPRTVFINPPPASGSLRSVDAGTLTVQNARAVGNDETRDYWSGGTDRTFETNRIVYAPNYNVYQNAPETVFTGSMVYNDFDGRVLPLSEERLVDGRRISLVALDGDLQRTQAGTVSIEPRTVSGSTRTVSVQGDGTNPVTFVVPTQLDASTWENELLAEEYDGTGDPNNDRYIDTITDGPGADQVTITMEAGGTYDLSLSKVGVGTGATNPGAAYVTEVEAPVDTVENDTLHEFTMEVRDAYNNPVSGVDVTASASLGTFDDADDTRTTDEDGRVTFTYTAPGPAEVGDTDSVSFSAAGVAAPEGETTYSIDIRGAGGAAPGSGGGSGGDGGGNTQNVNPGEEGSVILRGTTESGGTVTIEFENTGSEDRTWDEARISFYYDDNSGATSAEINSNTADELVVGEDFETVDETVTITAGGTGSVNLDFSLQGGGNVKDSFFIISVRYQNTNAVNTYFVAVP